MPPVHRRATHKTKHTLIHTPKGNLERPINLTGMSLDCGRKPDYPERIHACTGRTCQLHAERPPAGNRTQNLLAARQQCYPLRFISLTDVQCCASVLSVQSFYAAMLFKCQ
ncbi:hypothetical protein CHARACLAT_010722 [Characodon lateralis]|uniref:Uncharacterized protein n=1 Tax=Characodon lateralis TaxID=208331 RepID=A0ABU7ESL9_9TELE|nr:hypothetical protein [Characodon lateralis]